MSDVEIRVAGPWYFSGGDEEVFYRWLRSLGSVVTVGGVGKDLLITLSSRYVPEDDLRELLAIFHRYRMDKRVLVVFDRADLAWFRDPGQYWYDDVFGPQGADRE